MLTLEFPASADFHRRQAEEPKNVSVIREALYEVTGHRLGVTLALGEGEDAVEEEDEALTEDALISMFKDTFDAQEVEDTPMSKFDMNKLMQQAQQMQSQMQQMQEEAANEVVEASAGGGMVTVKATGGGEIVGDHDRPEGDRPGRPGDARRPRPRRRQRGAPLRQRADGVEDAGDAAGRARRARAPGL